MDDNILKTGCCSIILGKNHYNGYFPMKLNKLLKVTKIIDRHNEFKYLDTVRKIANYEKYYAIPDSKYVVLFPEDLFYRHLEKIVKNMDNIFNDKLYCFYINYAGNMDVLDSINSMNSLNYSQIWTSINSILKFSKHIMKGLDFLHQNKICHLDIKPENLMINLMDKSFRIIDFGFSSVEPFDDYIKDIRGTPAYFPKYYPNNEDEGLPKIEANDLILINGQVPMATNRELVYKIDSYCLGRVINCLYYFYEDIYLPEYTYCCLRKNETKKLNKLIKLLLENDVNNRLTIGQILRLNII